jgi:hypothetical protein
MEKFLAVSGDGFPRMFGQGERGMGHAVLNPAGFQGDALCNGPRIERACGSTLPTEKAVEKFLGDKQCPKCVEWLDTPEGVAAIESARAERAAWEDGGESVREALSAMAPGVARDAAVREIWTGGSDPDPVATRKAAVTRERERLAKQAEKRKAVRENSAPTLPGTEIIASTGKTLAAMNEETATFYANGGKPSVEITSLPAPGTVALGMATQSGSAAEILVCEFTGGVEIVNPERTHGKCPGCTTYIPLLDEKAARESAAPKVSKEVCASVGERPASGTQVLRDDHTVKVADDHNGKTSAPCPGCSRMIAVSREGGMRRHNGMTPGDPAPASADRIGTHNVGGVATPAGKGLSSKSMDTVEHGSVPGDPATADARRAAESRCERSRKVVKDATGGTIPCPTCERPVELKRRESPTTGKITWSVPDHIRPGVSVRHVGHGDVRDVTPRGEGSDVGTVRGTGHGRETAVKGARLTLGRGQGITDGSATTGSQNMAPVQPKGWVGTAGTGILPAMVRPGVDPSVTGDICPLEECGGQRTDVAHKGKGKSWRRRHSAKMGAVLRERDAARKAKRDAAIASGERLAPGERKAARKAASVGSFSEGNVNGNVTHETRPGYVAKGARKVAPRPATQREKDDARKALASVK